LAQGPLLADGAMGTELYNRGIPLGQSFEAATLQQPDLVQSIHLDYLKAGAELIETNTFGANRVQLASYGLAGELSAINRQAGRLARYARDMAGSLAFIAGAMGPLGQPLAPLGPISEAEALAAYGLSVRDLRNRRCMRDADRVLHMNNHGFWLGQRRFGGPVVKCRQLFGLESSGLGQVADYFDITLDVRDARTIIIRHRDDFRRIHYRCSRCSKVDFLSGVKLTRTSRNQWAVEPLVRK